ncbi:tail fiber domain-containing protein [Mucilaginibacter sp. RB4R14]|uniref:tail fiber domain-containing protein n=1 Tax=Mucilaginibacter aurantiaciroseus TaxID=2949308 RepID=UPI002091473D|nr:tail fiber domain-containing protein [Mucilaginibacter aurantiaciroseus]MCO5936086.1 tail fiber domain-containing protein [Mucilaginibacter aurantiaciroseus]
MKIYIPFILFLLIVLSAFCASAQTLSDAQIKTNAAPVTNSLSYINRLQPVTYQYNRSEYKQLNLPTGTQFGFIANDAKLVVPSAITTHNNWYTAGKGSQRALTTTEVDFQKLVPLLVGAVKEQQAQIEQLRAEIDQLKNSK